MTRRKKIVIVGGKFGWTENPRGSEPVHYQVRDPEKWTCDCMGFISKSWTDVNGNQNHEVVIV